LRTLAGHTASVFEVVFSPDGKRLASASDDGQVKIWNASSGEEQLTFGPGATTAYHLTFSPDGKTITTTEANGRTQVWDTATGKRLSVTEPPAPAAPAVSK
jgi:WD40 repeat protein